MGEIKIIVNKKTGDLKVEGVGYSGLECTQDIDDVLRSISATVTNEELKEEAKITQNINIRSGR